MLSPEDLEYAGEYEIPNYPNDDSVHIKEYVMIQGRIATMDDVMKNYMYVHNLHDLAMAIARNDDILSMAILVSENDYMPIRWEAIYDASKDEKLRYLITSTDKYIPRLTRRRISLTELDDDNYLVALHQSLMQGDMDIVEEILTNYGDPRDLLSPYGDAPLPAATRKYLVLNNYIDVSDREKMIINDDPTVIESLTTEDMSNVLRYDSINIFKSMMKVSDSVDLIHGSILSYLISTSDDYTLIERLIPKCNYEDLVVLTHRDVPRVPVYIECGKRGYFELLINMTRRDLLLLITNSTYDTMNEAIHVFIDYMYKDIYMNDNDLIEGAVINDNESLLQGLLPSSTYPMRELVSLVYEYHMWEKNIVKSLLSVISRNGNNQNSR